MEGKYKIQNPMGQNFFDQIYLNPCDAESTFVQSTRMQRFLKII